MRKRIGQLLQIKPGEGVITSLMFAYVTGVLCFYYILKPLRSALFLSELPASSLPNAYLLTALLAGPLVTLVFKFSRRLSVIGLVTYTNLGIVASLLLFRWAVDAELRFLPYAYFAYVQIVSVLCVAQFWLLAGYIFDSRQAKRIYGLLGAGAITGSIAGSLITDFLKHLSMPTMLSICVGICLVLILLARIIWRCRRPDLVSARESRKSPEAAEHLMDMLRVIFGSRLLKLMVLLVFLTMIASQIADWQVDYFAQEKYKDLPDQVMGQEIKAFRARFNWVTNVAGIVLQLTVTQFVIRRVGIWAAILFLPIGLGATSIGVLFAPSLPSATVALGCNSVFRYSINRAGLELLFLPLSPNMRKKIKLFIDVFVDRVGRAAAAFIILGLNTQYLPAGLKGTAFAVVALTGACLIAGMKLRKTYVDAFRQKLARREVDLSEVGRYVTDPASLRLLVAALESSQERQILYSLGLLQAARGYDFSSQLLPLLSHPSPFVREEALRTLPALPGNHEAEAAHLLDDESDGVRGAAVEYLCLHNPERTGAQLLALLGHDNADVRLAAGRCAADQPEPVFRPSPDLVWDLMALDGSRSIRAHQVAARLAARLPAAESLPVLRQLFLDSRREVAGSAVVAAGGAGHLELASDILQMLGRRELRTAARQALIAYGPRVTAILGEALRDEKQDPALRREIPAVLSRIQDPRAADALLENLGAEDFSVRYQVVKALSRIHAHDPDSPGKRPLLAVHVITQTMSYYERLALREAIRGGNGGAGIDLLGRALQERLDGHLEIVFRLLGLVHPQKDIYFAYTALTGQRPEKRTAAIEFLDNILNKDVKSHILPLLEEESPELLLARAARLFGVGVPARVEALRAIVQQPDPWLRACALHAIGAGRIAELADLCRQMTRDHEYRVRETADWALQQLRLTKDGSLHADQP